MLKSLKQARAALSMLNPNEVMRVSSQPVHIGLVSPTEAGYMGMENFLLTDGASWQQLHRADNPKVPDKVDVVLYAQGTGTPDGGYEFDPENTAWIDAILD